MNSTAAKAAHLDYQIGAMIRETYCCWNQLGLTVRRDYVERFQGLRDELIAVTGKNPAQITPPWTDKELDATGDPFRLPALLADPSPLESAVNATERCQRKTGNLPVSLNSNLRVSAQLEPVPHGKSLAQLEAIHAVASQRKDHHPPQRSMSNQETGWINTAERKVRARQK